MAGKLILFAVEDLCEGIGGEEGLVCVAVVGDIFSDGGFVVLELKAGEDLSADGFVSGVDVVGMEGEGVIGFVLPELGDSAREQAQHTANALKSAKGGEFVFEDVHKIGVEGIIAEKASVEIRFGAIGLGEDLAHLFVELFFFPKRSVGFDDLRGFFCVDGGEEAFLEDEGGFIGGSGFKEGGFSCGDAFEFFKFFGDGGVFVVVGIGAFEILADGEGKDEGSLGCAFDGFEEGREEGGELCALLVAFDAAEVDRHFIEQDDGGLGFQESGECFCTGCGVGDVAFFESVVAVDPGELIGKEAPRGVDFDAIAGDAVGGVGVFAIEGCDASGLFGKERRVEKVGGVGDAAHTVGGMVESDESVRFTAAKLRIKAKDRRDFLGGALESKEDLFEEGF